MSDGFLDTDVIIRFLTADDSTKQVRAAALLDRVEGEELELEAPVTVIADAIHVLSSRTLYAWPRTRIGAALGALLSIRRFRVDNREEVLRALQVYSESNLDFGDAMLVACMELRVPPVVYSFDRDFNRFPWITRLEP